MRQKRALYEQFALDVYTRIAELGAPEIPLDPKDKFATNEPGHFGFLVDPDGLLRAYLGYIKPNKETSCLDIGPLAAACDFRNGNLDYSTLLSFSQAPAQFLRRVTLAPVLVPGPGLM